MIVLLIEPKTYHYAKYLIYFMTFSFGGIELFLLYASIDFIIDKEISGALMFFVMLALNAVALTYYIRKFFIPAMRNRPAIILDNEKLQYFIDDWEINWEDIESVTINRNGGVNLKNGEVMTISLKWVNAEPYKVDETMSEYLENAN